jgi:hypothetical protein
MPDRDRTAATPHRVDPATAGAKPVRIGVYDRPAGGRHHALYLALAVIIVAVIAWLLFAHRSAAAATPVTPPAIAAL